MRHLRWNGYPTIDFFADKVFIDFKNSLNAEMKRLQAKGLGLNKRQAEPITEQGEEDRLWEMGLHGDHCPKVLLNIIMDHILSLGVVESTDSFVSV